MQLLRSLCVLRLNASDSSLRCIATTIHLFLRAIGQNGEGHPVSVDGHYSETYSYNHEGMRQNKRVEINPQKTQILCKDTIV